MNAHLYLRASTKDQDAHRAKKLLETFAAAQGLDVAGIYSENISGTKLERPELMRLLDTASPGEILLCESVDRLSRLSQADWETLKGTIKAKGLRLVVADLPTSWQMATDGIAGEVMRVINDMLIELMQTMARLDQAKRVERITQGLEKKRAEEPDWKPVGKGKNAKLWKSIKETLAKHPTMNADEVAKLVGCGVATIYRVKRELKA
ncbi:putative transposon DNA-invertase Bin3 [Pseudomonas extremaustralis]|uniref:recombinase family protein n=1 Tax=Pseudomonas extremaustralis TaxID=359110 RepID=UPI002AA0BD33|nr:recombinase family protein [Pseudomonas extremaustralis]MDY7065675.1 putative transposon DNA-invertase Bin3 [Pseudomonas extremaustralis]